MSPRLFLVVVCMFAGSLGEHARRHKNYFLAFFFLAAFFGAFLATFLAFFLATVHLRPRVVGKLRWAMDTVPSHRVACHLQKTDYRPSHFNVKPSSCSCSLKFDS